jgi:hypothetical protein
MHTALAVDLPCFPDLRSSSLSEAVVDEFVGLADNYGLRRVHIRFGGTDGRGTWPRVVCLRKGLVVR